MSWWTDLRDSVESGVSDVSPIDIRSESARNKNGGLIGDFNSIRNYEEGLFNKLTGRPSAADTRAQAQQVADQINAYKQQTQLEQQQLNDARNQADAEKRRIQEKQIRSLRRNYSAQGIGGGGLLGQGAPATQDMTTNLGG